jgi:hypothetical protein
MILGLTVILLASYYFLAVSSGKVIPGGSVTRSGSPEHFWLSLTYPLYLLCLAANFQATDTGPTSILQAVQHLGLTLPVLGFGVLAPLYAGAASLKGEVRGSFGTLKRGEKHFDRTIDWYQKNGMVCMLFGGVGVLTFMTGLWLPLLSTLS